MKKLILLNSFVFLLILSLSAQVVTPYNMSNIPTGGIPLAQIFDSKVADDSQYDKNFNKVYFVWGAKNPVENSAILSSRYFPSIRNPDRKLDINWYKANHPDWVMYQQDGQTPAYGYVYSYGGLVPLDVSNPEVQKFYLEQFVLPTIKKGYKAVAMDNVDFGNWPKSVGHYQEGKWVNLYTGQKNDTLFHQNMINWMKYLKSNLAPLGVKVVANIKADTAPEKVILEAINAVDVWLDETGFAHRGTNILDKEWAETFSILQKIAPIRGYVSINQMQGNIEDTPKAQVEWVIGNFLLSRGPQSLLAMVSYTDKAIYHTFNYREELNADIGEPLDEAKKTATGIWYRSYSKGYVYVNPSSQKTINIDLPKGSFKGLDGEKLKGNLDISPATAKIIMF